MCTRVHSLSTRVLAITLGIAAGSLCQSAFAQAQSSRFDDFPDLNKAVFTKANRGVLCMQEGDRRIVSRVRLAWLLINTGKAITSIDLLRTANRDGIASGKAEELDGNAIYFVSSDTPFGLHPETYNEEQRAAAKRQQPVLASLQSWLKWDHAENREYELAGPSERPDAERYFQPQSGYEIVCKGERGQGSGGTSAPPGGTGGGGADAWMKSLIVRKNLAEVSASGGDLKKVKGAQVSYSDDQVAGKSTVTVEGLVGVVIAGTGADRAKELATKARGGGPESRDLYWYKMVPYVYYKNVSTDPASSRDMEYFSPGLTGTMTWVAASGKFAYDLQTEASGTLDSTFGSNVYNLGLRFSPSFYVGDKVLFGAPIGFGPLFVQPDFTLVARHRLIEDAGKNPELQLTDAYTSLGFDASVQLYLGSSSSLLSNIVGHVGFKYRDNSNDVVDIRRFETGLTYVLNTNTSLELTYTNGRDEDTLQDEQRLQAALSFRN
jgi:hypothetical protein